MSITPPKRGQLTASAENLGDSWVELHMSNPQSPGRVTPTSAPFSVGEEYIRLLKEAQRESNQSSARVSSASSRRDTPRSGGSPKSPPNSPNTDPGSTESFELKNVYINYSGKEEKNTDWVWDWSSRPDQKPPKEWKFRHPKKVCFIRNAKVGNNGLFSKEVLYTLVITNILSLLLGTGIGLYVTKNGFRLPRFVAE